jgi:hypothetical protein
VRESAEPCYFASWRPDYQRRVGTGTMPTRLNGDSTGIWLDCDRHKKRGALMPRKGITGHDEWVITEALATAFVALEQLPPKHRPQAHMEDIRKILASGREPAAVTLHLAQAKCRLFPELDPLTIYHEYGIGDGSG